MGRQKNGRRNKNNRGRGQRSSGRQTPPPSQGALQDPLADPLHGGSDPGVWQTMVHGVGQGLGYVASGLGSAVSYASSFLPYMGSEETGSEDTPLTTASSSGSQTSRASNTPQPPPAPRQRRHRRASARRYGPRFRSPPWAAPAWPI